MNTKKFAKRFIKFLIPVAFIMLLANCVSSTSSGVVGANRSQLMLVSSEEMDASARESYAQVIAQAKAEGKLNVDAAMTRRVLDVTNRLIPQCVHFREDALGWDWQVNVITSDEVNAWCMPGGKIAVYTNIIRALNLTDGELAAVLGHEIAHALREHSREQASQNAIANLGLGVVSQIMGLDDTGNALLGLAATYTIAMPFSRSHETESDHVGTELMARAGYDPYEAVHIWEKMQALGGASVPEILSTHPSNESRIKDLTKIAQEVYPLYEATKK